MNTQKLIAQCKKELGNSLPTGDTIENGRLNGFVRQILEGYMIKKHPKTLRDSLLLDTVVMLSIVACSKRVKIESIKGGSSVYPNIYAIKVMPSSSGKDLPLALAQEELLDGVIMDLKSKYRVFLEDFKVRPYDYLENLDQNAWEEMTKKEKDEALKQGLPNDFLFSFDSGTIEGLVSQCNSIKLFKKGVAFCMMNEFGTYITKADSEVPMAFISGLLKAFDVREFGGKVIRSSKQTLTVKDTPVILLGNTSSRWIKDEDSKETLMKFIGGGLGRRSFIFYPTNVVVEDNQETIQEILQQRKANYQDVKNLQMDIRNEILNKYNAVKFDTVLSYTQEAEDFIEIYSLYGELMYDSLVNKQEAVASEYRGRSWKMVRLAGLFAWLNGHTQIDKQDVSEAIYFTEYFSEKTSKFIYDQENEKLPEEKLLDWLIANAGRHLKTEIRKEGFIGFNKSKRDYEELFENTKEVGGEMGYDIVIRDTGNKITIEAIPLIKSDEGNIPIMVAPKQDDFEKMKKVVNYTRRQIKWEDLPDIVTNYQYMPQLSSGYRNKENAIDGGTLLALDIDDNWTLNQAKDYFTKEKIKCFIITTASHQKSVDKSGKKTQKKDRFRVIILLKYAFEGGFSKWSTVYSNFANSLGAKVDNSTKDMTRSFFPSPQDATYYFIEGEALDWKQYDYQPKRIPKAVQEESTDFWEKKALEKLNQEYNAGNRDNTMRDVVYMLQNHGVSAQRSFEIVKNYYETHPTTGDPIDLNKFKKEINT